MTSGPITSWQIDKEIMVTVTDLFSWAPKTLQIVTVAMKLEDLALWNKNYDKPRQGVKKQRRHFANKDPYNQRYCF